MKLARILINDFLSIGAADLATDDLGLVAIQGQNNDNPSANSNGAGKSSIVDAITWGLYGETARGIGTDAVIRHGTKKASVALELVDESTGVRFNLLRSRQKGKGSLQLWREDMSGKAEITLGTEKLTQDALVKIIGCSREVFMAAVCLGQEQMPDLPSMTDRKLKELIEEAAGVGVLEAAYAVARERSLEVEKKLVAQQRMVDALVLREASLMEDARELEEKHRDWEGGRKLRVLDLKDQLAISHAKRQAVGDRNHILLNLSDVQAGIARLNKQLEGFADAQKAERRLQSAVTDAQSKLAKVETIARHAKQAYEKAKQTLADTKAADTCDSCGQHLPGDAHKHACDGAGATLEACKQDAVAALGALQAAKAGVAATEERLAAHRAGMGDPSAVQAAINKAQAEVNNHFNAIRDIEAIDRESLRLSDAIKQAETEASPFESLISSKRVEAANLRFDISAAETDLHGVQQESAELKTVVQIFGPAGVRAHVLDQVTPYLNERTSAYLDLLSEGTIKAAWSTLTPNAKGELREKFAIEVTHPAGEGFGALSGGEKRKVRIACALALQDLVASRATKPFRLLAVDEIDDALDDAGLERLMTVLHEKSKERGTVLIISHNSLTDWIQQVFTVVKESGISSVQAL